MPARQGSRVDPAHIEALEREAGIGAYAKGLPTSYADIEPLPPEWLWQGRIPSNLATVIAGDGGIGKGFLLADIVARVTRGLAMPDGSPGNAPRSVVMVTSEDDPNMAMAYRLRAAHADLSRVYDMTEGFLIPDAMPALYEAVDSVGDVGLLVVDPLSAVASIPLTSSNVKVRRMIIEPLERLARDRGIAVAAVHHTVKSGRVAGSKGITDAVRMVLRVSRLAQDERVRVIHVEKSNIASDSVSDVAYRVAGSFPDVAVEYVSLPDSGRTPDRVPSTSERIVSTLQGAAAPMSAQDLARVLGMSYGAVRVALTRLNRDQVVQNPTRGQWELWPLLAA